MIADIADLLACPVCRDGLALEGRTLGCPTGHRFDVARQGHVNLLGRAAPRNADTAAMVQARIDFLTRGHYRLIDDALAALAHDADVVVDAGAGPGVHLGVVQAVTGARAIATDVSAYACRRAAKVDRTGAVVADTWAGLPIRDGIADVVMAVFAPRNPGEFARVLTPGGRLLVVTPRRDHLASLRTGLGLLGVEDAKLARLDQAAAPHFRLVNRFPITAELALDADAVRDLVLMGPNAFHRTEREWEPATTDLSVDVSAYAKL